MSTVLVAGATGLVGGFLLEELQRSAKVDRVIALARRPLGIGVKSKVEVHVVDFNLLAEERGAFKCDAVFSCLGTTIKAAGSQEAFRRVDHDYVVALADLGLFNGAKSFFLVSAMGADPSSSFFYNHVKGEAERSVLALGYPNVSVFRPSLLLGERTESRPGEKLAIKLAPFLRPLLIGPFAPYRPIEARMVALAMRVAFERDEPGTHVYPSDKIQALAASALH